MNVRNRTNTMLKEKVEAFGQVLSHCAKAHLDMVWEKKFSHLGPLIRYADDLVAMCRKEPEALTSI